MAPNISIRESIRWLPHPSSEPTSTIVLTSAENYFVDIRVFLETTAISNVTTLPLQPSVDWAIGGKSSAWTKDKDGQSPVIHSKWTHWVDSRIANADGVADEGDMVALDESRTLETGNMVNPETGQATDYEEIWKDEPVVSTDALSHHSKYCVVLTFQDQSKRVQGMIVRLGQYCQGVLRANSSFALQRWQWFPDTSQSPWTCAVRVGNLEMPCEDAVGRADFKVADVIVDRAGRSWVVSEATRF